LFIIEDKYLGDSEMATDDKKHAKFRELAEKRTNKALEAVRLIGNLSNRQTYVYEDVEVRKIMKALRDAVSEVETRFGKASSRSGGEFKL
jgi:hypothetical protein